jgi:hypothetical protein
MRKSHATRRSRCFEGLAWISKRQRALSASNNKKQSVIGGNRLSAQPAAQATPRVAQTVVANRQQKSTEISVSLCLNQQNLFSANETVYFLEQARKINWLGFVIITARIKTILPIGVKCMSS